MSSGGGNQSLLRTDKPLIALQPLYDPDADRILVEELRKQLKPEIEVRKLDMYLNTPEFAMAMVEAFEAMMKEQLNRKSIPSFLMVDGHH